MAELVQTMPRRSVIVNEKFKLNCKLRAVAELVQTMPRRSVIVNEKFKLNCKLRAVAEPSCLERYENEV